MTIARKDIIDWKEVRNYHCTVRCVRRAFLCGQDSITGKDFEHRRQWIRDRLQFLSSVFAIEVISYAVLSNHLHVLLRTRPDLANGLSDREVALRWLTLYPPKDFRLEGAWIPSEVFLKAALQNENRLQVCRRRLADLSWFMGRLDEFIARKANREDKCKGRFWEGRFRCKLLLDEAALLTCMAYIDLNPIRAGETQTPEESSYTSAYDRIRSYRAQKRLQSVKKSIQVQSEEFLIWIDELQEDRKAADWLCPLQTTTDRRGALDSVSLEEYLCLLDWAGREVVMGKRSSIPIHLEPILGRLSIDIQKWLDTLEGYDNLFRRILGRAEKVIESARTAGLRWFQGIRICRVVFG